MQPVNPFLEEGIASGHRLVVAPVVGRLQLLRNGRELREHHVADRAARQQSAERVDQRLVMIVLTNQHDAAGAVARVEHGAVVSDPSETPASPPARACRRRARPASGPGETAGGTAMTTASTPGSAIAAPVVAIAAGAAVAAAEVHRLLGVTAGVAPDHVAAERTQVAAVYARDEAAAQEGDVYRLAASKRNHDAVECRRRPGW